MQTNAMLKKTLIPALIIYIIFFFDSFMNAQTRYDEINVLINRGGYSTAAKKIDSLISAADLSGEEIYSRGF